MKTLYKQTLHFFVITAAVFMLPDKVGAQYQDAQLWLSGSIEKNITHKLALTLNPQLRLNENMTELGKHFLDAGIAYKLFKNIKTSFNYRFINQRLLDDAYIRRHRFYVDLSYKYRFQPLGITYRIRYQNQHEDKGIMEDWSIASNYLRHKIEFEFNNDTRFEPSIASELWFNLNNRTYNSFRIKAGSSYEVNKRTSFDLSYLIDKKFNVKKPDMHYIISAGYTYSF